MNHRVVLFHESGARILHGIDPKEYQHVKECLIDPVHPSGVPPHYWKKEGDKIIEMSKEEKTQRDALLLSFDSTHNERVTPISYPPLSFRHYAVIALVSAAAAAIVLAAFEFLFH